MGFLDIFKKETSPEVQLNNLELSYSKIESEMDRYQVEIARSKDTISNIDIELAEILNSIEKYTTNSETIYDDDEAKALLSQMVMLQEEQSDVKLEFASSRSCYNELRPLHRAVKNKIYSMQRAMYDAKTFGTPISTDTIEGIIDIIQETDDMLGQKTSIDAYKIRRFKEKQRDMQKDTLNADVARMKGVLDIDRVINDIKQNPNMYNPSIIKAYEIIESPNGPDTVHLNKELYT
ncbi:MAG: hypothetical protein K0B02_02085 [DPANN group archaeon]|nr:hypothetical protein [DPANN group archaeon]